MFTGNILAGLLVVVEVIRLLPRPLLKKTGNDLLAKKVQLKK